MNETVPSPTWRPAPGAAVRRAATLVVLRDSDAGMQVLLMRRTAREGDIHSGACVFPGGLLDAADREAHAFCDGLNDAAVSAAMGLPEGGLDYRVAAMRECLEEAGLLFATHPASAPTQAGRGANDGAAAAATRDPGRGKCIGECIGECIEESPGASSGASPGESPGECIGTPDATPAGAPAPHGTALTPHLLAQIDALRPALNRGELSMAGLCRRFGLRLAADRLLHFSHWLTPPGAPKRYDTHFFVAEAPALQVASHDAGETVERLWITPAQALAQLRELNLVLPTVRSLQRLQQLGSIEAVMAHARALTHVPCWMPHLGTGSRGVRPVPPDEPAWAELGRLDPQGHGQASYELTPGRAVRLSERLIRITAPNGSVMTGPGTNTYLIGGGERNEWAALDPGPAIEAHVQAILDAAPGPIRWIFVTHTHQDHSPAAQALKQRTGAQLLGMAALHAEWQDTGFVPDVPLRGGERIALPGPPGTPGTQAASGEAGGSTLRVIHTPGHAGNHLCYLLEQERLLFTGDHVMQGSTVVINPPDGDMGAYLRSLNELRLLPLDWLAPGHGFLMAEPQAAMQRIVEHRLAREAKVLAAVPVSDQLDVDSLLGVVYADVPAHLHAMARRSLTAHLLKLQHDGRLAEAHGRWRRVRAQD